MIATSYAVVHHGKFGHPLDASSSSSTFPCLTSTVSFAYRSSFFLLIVLVCANMNEWLWPCPSIHTCCCVFEQARIDLKMMESQAKRAQKWKWQESILSDFTPPPPLNTLIDFQTRSADNILVVVTYILFLIIVGDDFWASLWQEKEKLMFCLNFFKQQPGQRLKSDFNVL